MELLAVRNGYQLAVEDLVLADTVTSVACGEVGYEELAAWSEERLEPVASGNPHPRPESANDP